MRVFGIGVPPLWFRAPQCPRFRHLTTGPVLDRFPVRQPKDGFALPHVGIHTAVPYDHKGTGYPVIR